MGGAFIEPDIDLVLVEDKLIAAGYEKTGNSRRNYQSFHYINLKQFYISAKGLSVLC